MTDYFSNHYTETGSAQTAVDRNWKTSAGIGHARLRYKACRYTGQPQTTDLVRLMTFKSSDRLVKLVVSAPGTPTAGTLNVGAHLSGLNHDGAVIDADIFATALDTTGALAQSESLTENALEHEDRAKPLWEQASEVTATYTADPGVDIDITITPAVNTDASQEYLVEAWYTAGD